MKSFTQITNPIYNFLPTDIEGFDLLAELALDMRWSWNHSADDIWHELDSSLWNLTHNPWLVLQTVSHERLRQLLQNTEFRQKINFLLQQEKEEEKSPGWFQFNHSRSGLNGIAYLSMEFMLSEALPIYSGGLGNVAGDQLKAASDLGVPIIGIGLLYHKGYFRQEIDINGTQQVIYPYNDPGQLPITPLRQSNGEWLRMPVAFPGYSVWVRIWQVQAGRVRLFLLDSNDSANLPIHQGITGELYGGGPEIRLKQEILLGIGGWQLMNALGMEPEICHLNEGHAAFAVLERARTFMDKTGVPFDVALSVTRAGNLFTTHTAVSAGFDCYSPKMIEKNLKDYIHSLGITLDQFLAMGRRNPNDDNEDFNMAYLAIHGSSSVNGVSALHEQVSKKIFAPLFNRWPNNEIPINHITNGIHVSSWDSKAADKLWTAACGKDRWLGTTEEIEQKILSIGEEHFWEMKCTDRKALVDYARKRLALQLTTSGESPQKIEEARNMLNPDTLTLGFARRFTSYKRPNLLLNNPQRLLSILLNYKHPVQLILAGKAHPNDWSGQKMIQEWIQFIQKNDVRDHVIFLSDYDMLIAEHLLQGVDVWINTPRRPWEACGTSGMKVLVNGGLNLSELDGWWAEAYTPEVGWAIGDFQEHGEDPAWDAAEANAIYTLLEQNIVPEFYKRDEREIPIEWVQRMRKSAGSLTPRFSANRVVREYTEKFYLPMASNYQKRSAENGKTGQEIAAWKKELESKWSSLRFGELKVETKGYKHDFEVNVLLYNLNPDAVSVELYADGSIDHTPIRQTMTRGDQIKDGYVYHASVSALHPISDFSPRIIPYFKDVTIPIEENRIIWQH